MKPTLEASDHSRYAHLQTSAVAASMKPTLEASDHARPAKATRA